MLFVLLVCLWQARVALAAAAAQSFWVLPEAGVYCCVEWVWQTMLWGSGVLFWECVTDVGGSSSAALPSPAWGSDVLCWVCVTDVGGSSSADLFHSWVLPGAVMYRLLCVCLWQMHVYHHCRYCYYCLGKWYRSPLPQWAVAWTVMCYFMCVCVTDVSSGSSAELFSASLCHLEHWCIVV